MNSRLVELTARLSTRHWKLLTIAMLVLLHLATVRLSQDAWARGLMLAHFGLFLVWQPFLQSSQRLGWKPLLGLSAVMALVFLSLTAWLAALWVAMLAGLVGGKVFLNRHRGQRLFYLLMLSYLLGLLFVWLVPGSLPGSGIEPEFQDVAQWFLIALPLAMLLVPVSREPGEPQVIDLVYATLTFLLVLVLVLAGFAFMTVGRVTYAQGLVFALITLAVVLMLLSLVWNPRAGFSAASAFFSRYLLSVGLPFEQWLLFLAEISRTEIEPARFLARACAGLCDLQWVQGVRWRAGGDAEEFGQQAGNPVRFDTPELSLQVWSRPLPSPALVWHLHVLGRLLLQFYLAKQREVQLRQQSYIQAVHETGARLTHDVKNLLQSLNALCAAATREGGDPAAFQAMVRRSLPVVTQRLQATLDKLEKPPVVETGRFVQPQAWWDTVLRSYSHPALSFQCDIRSTLGPLPKDLFDTAADNLINNALDKHRRDPAVRVAVSLVISEQIRFSVTDTGRVVPAQIARGLFSGPVASETGYGIGLYQVARQAQAAGFVLELASNEPGNVAFVLGSEG